MDLRLTADLNPSSVRKTVEHLAAYTATSLNRIQGQLMGSSRVLRGMDLTPLPDAAVRVGPGSFIANGVIVELLAAQDLSYDDLLDEGFLPDDGSGRVKSLVLYAYSLDAKRSSEIRIGFAPDTSIQDIEGDGFVVLGVLSPSDEGGEEQTGIWASAARFSADALARDVRDGVQNVESSPFSGDTGLRLRNPRFATAPYFLFDRELLAFADRFLIPSRAVSPEASPSFRRLGITGISEVGLGDAEAASFDFGGRYDDAFNLLEARWGFVVDRDIEWQQVLVEDGGDLELSREVPDDNRTLVFEDGLWMAPSEYVIDGADVTITAGVVSGAAYHFVRLRDVAFVETSQIQAADLDAPGVASDHILDLSGSSIDVNRQSVLVFARVTSGGPKWDGGYFQIGRRGTAGRAGQSFKIRDGFQIESATSLRLRGLTMADGVVATIGVVCLRGATPANVLQQGEGASFYRRWAAVGGTPADGEAKAAPHLDAFVTALPSGAGLDVAVNDLDGDASTADGVVVDEGFFTEYALEQPPGMESEAAEFKTPRRVLSSSAPEQGTAGGFGDAEYQQVALTIEGGAAAAALADGVRLRAGRMIEGVPQYVPGEDKLRVYLDGVKLVRGRDYEERSSTSLVLRLAFNPGQILEAVSE